MENNEQKPRQTGKSEAIIQYLASLAQLRRPASKPKQQLAFEPLSMMQTARRCHTCLGLATTQVFKVSDHSGLNISSRRFACEAHKELVAP